MRGEEGGNREQRTHGEADVEKRGGQDGKRAEREGVTRRRIEDIQYNI